MRCEVVRSRDPALARAAPACAPIRLVVYCYSTGLPSVSKQEKILFRGVLARPLVGLAIDINY